MIAQTRIAAAFAAAVLLGGCAGGGGGTALTNVVPAAGTAGKLVPAQKLTIAGIGDSLTAGTQSGGTMGADLPVLGTNPQLGQIGPVQRTQEHGFFSLLWQQANGVDINTMSDPTKSPLPLLVPPGLGGLLAPTTAGFPFPVTNSCDAKQLPANQFSTALSLRLNPNTNPWDVAIPGQTMHEALFMTGAIGDCTVNGTNAPANFVQLNALVNGESQNFWPILAGFGNGVAQVDAAVSLHAQVATIYLGSNDLLKFAFTNGAAPIASPQSIHDDVKAIIQKLQASGTRQIAVANLVDVMGAATFISQPTYEPILAAFISGTLQAPPNNVPKPIADMIAASYAGPYASQESAQLGLGPNGYFTINALFATLQTAAAQIPAKAPPVAPTLGAGTFITGLVADHVKALNLAYSAGISQAVSETNVALVDTYSDFKKIEAAGGIAIAPKCCSLIYRGGFFSLDGLHPSNTGYAVLANEFINALDAKYSLGIPPVNVAQVYATDPYAPGNGFSGFSSVLRGAK